MERDRCGMFSYIIMVSVMQVDDGIVLPDKASLHLTAIEDADYKEDKIECELIYVRHFKLVYLISFRCYI